MTTLPTRTALAALLLAVVALAPAVPEAPTVQTAPALVQVAAKRDCIGRNNLDEVAAKFIGRCKKGSIRERFPSDRLSRTLGQILAGNGKVKDDTTAWKLINSHEYDK